MGLPLCVLQVLSKGEKRESAKVSKASSLV